MTARRRPATTTPRRQIGLALLLVLSAGLASFPARASTESELEDARRRLEAVRADLTHVTQRWQDTTARLARAQDAADAARAEIARLEQRSVRIQRDLNDRVAAAYMSGGSFSMGAILTSDSIQDAADRLQFALSVVQGDADLAAEVAVTTEALRREEATLRQAARREAQAAEQLEAERASLIARIGELDDLVADLRAELSAQQEIALGIGVQVQIGSGAIRTCPAAGPGSFVDSFGDPRPGGRSHQGTDIMAAPGTPVVAVAPGSARPAGSIGGLGAVVQHPNGDWTFYAHLSSYGTLGPVSTGTVIGYVGDHLHFEYHPSGGPAVNPYEMLRAVC
jgi:murein DD-endopeptidase MepM/ murein hydrolase activator NlpD